MRISTRVLCPFFMMVVMTTYSLAQLTYTQSCNGTCQAEQCTYSNWAYTDSSHVKHYFSGSSTETIVSCKFITFGNLDTFSSDKEYYLQARGNIGSASPSGILYPKFKVVSIIYAAPGNLSNNGFTDTTTDGTTTSVASSFTAGWTETFTAGFKLFGAGSTMSWSFGQSTTTGNSTEFTNTISNALGVANDSVSTSPNVINHHQDIFIVWLNPSVILSTMGASSSLYGLGTQLQSTGDPSPGSPEIVDSVEVTAQTMLANSSGMTTVPVSILTPQVIDGQTLPGLASICANPRYYPNNCTLANQCGCVPSDFSAILNTDPILNYSSTANPLNADTSGATACTNPQSTAKCRYVPIMTTTGGTVQETELLAGPECSGCNIPVNSFNQTDSTSTAKTLSEAFSSVAGYNWSVTLPGSSGLQSATQFTWSDTESTGQTNGSSHSMAVSFSSNTVGCYEYIPIFIDTVFHTFVFQTPTGSNTCP